MRRLALLLLVANCALAVYARLQEGRSSDDAQLIKLQMSADKVKLLRIGDAAQDKPPQPAAKPVAATCLEWGMFAGPELTRAQAALARVQLAEKSSLREAADATGYWVYIPPLKTKPEVDRKLAELKSLGVQDFVLMETSQWRNAISLGVFRTEDAANAFLAQLRDKGVKSAVSGGRSGLVKLSSFVLRHVDGGVETRMVDLKQEFPGSELKAVACPAG